MLTVLLRLQEPCACIENRTVGETGLDAKYLYQSPLEKQTLAYVYQLQLAARHQLPLIIHRRDMHTPTLQLATQYLHHTHKIHIHCFTGTPEQAEGTNAEYIDKVKTS